MRGSFLCHNFFIINKLQIKIIYFNYFFDYNYISFDITNRLIYQQFTYPIIKKGEIVNFTEFDIHEWIDQAGGSSGNLVMVVSKEIFRVLGLNTETDQPEQKKSEMKS